MRKINFATTITKEEIANLPLETFEGRIHIVKSREHADKAVEILKKHTMLGFDTETKPCFKKGKKNHVALLQLSTAHDAFLFQLKYTKLPLSLISLLSDKNVLKVGAAIRDDIRQLQHLSCFEEEGFIDLQNYVKNYNIESSGLKKMAAIVLDIRISKSQQLSNWDSDELTEAQQRYAATDAWICHEIYNRLIKIDPEQ